MSEGYLALDDEWRIVEFDETGRDAVLAVGDVDSEADIVGRRIWDLVENSEESIYYDRFQEAVREGTPVEFRARYPEIGEWYDVRVYPDDDRVSVFFSSIADDVQREQTVQRRAAVLGELYDVVRDPDGTVEEVVEAILGIGRRVLETEFGTLSRIDGDRYTFEVVDAVDDTIQAGDTVDLTWTNCEQVVLSEERVVLDDIGTGDPEVVDSAGSGELGLSCYVGTPVEVDDGIYGTLCFYDRSPRSAPFSEWEVGLIDLMGLLIGHELERRRTERRLRTRTERLEEFRRILTHDLKNPVTVAQGFASLAQETGDPDDVERVGEALDRIEAIIDDVSGLAQIGDGDVTPEPVVLGDVARSAWEMVSNDGSSLRVTGDVTVEGDPSRFQRLFQNLFSNAVSHNEASVTVEVGPLDDGFYVVDTGSGIPPDVASSVFEPGVTTGSGTGVGLAIVVEIAEAHGWNCSVTEGVAGGARFEFTGVDVD
jgi:hypothetical protein